MSLLQDTTATPPHATCMGCIFARYGSLTPAQLQALPSAVLDGKSVMISAPTATWQNRGHCRAGSAATLQRTMVRTLRAFRCPNPALANDMISALSRHFAKVGVAVALKHGDKPALPRVLPSWLITTPESLDSMLGRCPAAFVSLRVVIIDEIHLLDGTPRRDQLRILLRRLQCETSCGQLHIHLLSATLRAPQRLLLAMLMNARS